jgi:hypothetical protein
MLNAKLIAAGLLALAIGTASFWGVAAQEAGSPLHEGPSVSIPADKIKFFPSGIKTEKGEIKAGPAYGNMQESKHGTFIRMPHGFISAPHTHTEDYFGVVIEGVGANYTPGGEAVPLPPGSYWFQKGEEVHLTQCLSKTDCLFFIVQPGKFDYLPTK